MTPAVARTEAHGPLLNGSTCLLIAPFDMAATEGCRRGRGDPLKFTRTGRRGDLTDFECLFVPDEFCSEYFRKCWHNDTFTHNNPQGLQRRGSESESGKWKQESSGSPCVNVLLMPEVSRMVQIDGGAGGDGGIGHQQKTFGENSQQSIEMQLPKLHVCFSILPLVKMVHWRARDVGEK